MPIIPAHRLPTNMSLMEIGHIPTQFLWVKCKRDVTHAAMPIILARKHLINMMLVGKTPQYPCEQVESGWSRRAQLLSYRPHYPALAHQLPTNMSLVGIELGHGQKILNTTAIHETEFLLVGFKGGARVINTTVMGLKNQKSSITHHPYTTHLLRERNKKIKNKNRCEM